MPSLGPAEILVIFVVALMVFGPNRLPEIARQVGRGFREFRKVQEDLRSELRNTVGDIREPLLGGATPAPTLPPRDTAEPASDSSPTEPSPAEPSSTEPRPADETGTDAPPADPA